MGIVESPVGTGPAGSVFVGNSFYRETWGTRLDGRQVAKRSSVPRVAYSEVVAGIVTPFAPLAVGTRGTSFNRALGGKWAQEAYAGCPQQRYATEEPGKVQGPDRVGTVEGSCGYQARGVSIRGKFVLLRNLGYKTRGSQSS